MPRCLLINEAPSFASIVYIRQQFSRVPRGTANRHSQFHFPKSKMPKVWFALRASRMGLGLGLGVGSFWSVSERICNCTATVQLRKKQKNCLSAKCFAPLGCAHTVLGFLVIFMQGY